VTQFQPGDEAFGVEVTGRLILIFVGIKILADHL